MEPSRRTAPPGAWLQYAHAAAHARPAQGTRSSELAGAVVPEGLGIDPGPDHLRERLDLLFTPERQESQMEGNRPVGRLRCGPRPRAAGVRTEQLPGEAQDRSARGRGPSDVA